MRRFDYLSVADSLQRLGGSFRFVQGVSAGLTIAADVHTLWSRALELKAEIDERRVYRITVDSNDPLYVYLHEWVISQLPETRLRRMLLETYKIHGYEDNDEPLPLSPVTALRSGRMLSQKATGYGHVQRRMAGRYLFDNTGTETIYLKGHRIQVAIQQHKPSTWDAEDTAWKPRSSSLIFSMYSRKAQAAMMQHNQELMDKLIARANTPRFFTAFSYHWATAVGARPRNLDDLAFSGPVKEQLLADLHAFMAGEERYNQLGIPWHRGYLLEGPPGTGKSSLVKAIATKLGLGLYYLSLSKGLGNDTLIRLIQDIPPYSIVLLEELDKAKIAGIKDSALVLDEHISQDTLLNLFDGALTPHGLILFVVVNDSSKINPLLIRPGRIDYRCKLGYLTVPQLQEMFQHYYGKPFPGPLVIETNVTPADITECVKMHLYDPDAAAVAIREKIRLLSTQHPRPNISASQGDSYAPEDFMARSTTSASGG